MSSLLKLLPEFAKDTHQFIERMQNAGFKLAVRDDRLLVSPVEKLTDTQRAFIRQHKPALIAALTGKATAPAGADQIIRQAEAQGIRLWVDGAELRVRGHRETVQAILPTIRAHKPALIAVLTGKATTPKRRKEPLSLQEETEMLEALELARELIWNAMQLAQRYAPIKHADNLNKADQRLNMTISDLRGIHDDRKRKNGRFA